MTTQVWPALTGSAKQVEWATRLRHAAVEELSDWFRSQDTAGKHAPPALQALYTESLLRETSAEHWIWHRSPRDRSDLGRRTVTELQVMVRQFATDLDLQRERDILAATTTVIATTPDDLQEN